MELGDKETIPQKAELRAITLHFKRYREVPKQVADEAATVIFDVFKYMKYDGPPPQKIILFQKGLTLPSGEEIPGAYGFDEHGKPGFIKINVELAQKSFPSDGKPAPAPIAAAIVAAHEAVEHVNFMRGRPVLVSNNIVPLETHRKSETEQEANKIARKILLKRYGILVRFHDESAPSLKDRYEELVSILSLMLDRKETTVKFETRPNRDL